MFRPLARFGFLTLAVVTMPMNALGQSSARPALDAVVANGPTILTSNATLRARLEHIATRSSLWREALDQVRGTGRQVIVVTPNQVVVKDTPDSTSTDVFDASMVAAAAPIPQFGSEVRAVLVVVNLPLIEEIHRRGYSPLAELHWDLDRILVHEIYGHAFPYLLAGDLSGRCADPEPGQKASQACSIRRENAVREELRLGPRTGYGLDDLVLARHLED